MALHMTSTDSETDVKRVLGDGKGLEPKKAKESTTTAAAATETTEAKPAGEQPGTKAASEADKGGTTATTEDPSKSKLEKRFSTLTKKRKEAEQKAEYWEKEARRSQAEIEAAKKPAATTETQTEPDKSKEPDPDKFEDRTEYLKAWSRWDREQAAIKDKEERSKEAKVTEVKTAVQSLEKDFKTKADAFVKEHKDYDARIAAAEEASKASPVVFSEILEGGPALAYALMEDPDAWKELNSLPAKEQLKRIALIEAKLKGAAKTTETTATETPGKANEEQPKPITPVGSRVTVIKDPNKMSIREYDAWRRDGNSP